MFSHYWQFPFPLQCIIPPPSTPSERPIPTLAPNIKVVTGIITRSASTILIVFVGVTIFLFGSLRIYDHARVIQMNMEIALILAHLIILAPNFYTGDPEEPIPMVIEMQIKHSKTIVFENRFKILSEARIPEELKRFYLSRRFLDYII